MTYTVISMQELKLWPRDVVLLDELIVIRRELLLSSTIFQSMHGVGHKQ